MKRLFYFAIILLGILAITGWQSTGTYPTDFQNIEEFQQFVNGIGIVVVFDETGTLGCYDNALFYWRKAYDQGKRVYLDSVTPDEYNRYFTKRIQSLDEGHIVISTVIDRQLYWVDPSSAEIILRGELLK